MEDTVLRHNQVRRQSARRTVSNASIEDFDKKLGETDSYLELLLSQVSFLRTKCNEATSEDARSKYEKILKGAHDMSESIKHAIVLLQIAKNAALPSDTNSGPVKNFTTRTTSATPTRGSAVAPVPGDGAAAAVERGAQREEGSGEGIEQGEEAMDSSIATSDVVIAAAAAAAAATIKPDKTSAIPEISYSSSDDDDDFFDAKEQDDEDRPDFAIPDLDKPLGLDLNAAMGIGGSFPAAATACLQSPLTPTSDGDEIDYDALYDTADGDDGGDVDMKSHGSVITHLLSQVRIGMDLTKIVLPTFILERRSLLEMYSDFFAHPDLFLAIPEGQTAEERMVRVLRWYLSSFHAGRKSSIAKKPYNPIIGETFRCHWHLAGPEGSGSPVAGGPLSWCGENELTFVAEQVSHHPPISAFYAEHPAKRISVNAHIYTKSSFLGMSVSLQRNVTVLM